MPREMPASASVQIHLLQIHNDIVACEKCPRLRKYDEEVARVKRRAYREETYWGKPVPGFGDPNARLLIVGLAPGAHGANRTGRIFTGDRSGDFLYRALFENGFANQPESRSADDGLKLIDAYITGAVRCAPPDNKPALDEFARCRPYLEREIDALTRVRVVVALGKIAADTYLGILRDRREIRSRTDFPFGHGREYKVSDHGPVLLCCYHPSQQNTSTGRLTAGMLRDVFARSREIADESASGA
jgi:uracil-DNA glycosylase family 4